MVLLSLVQYYYYSYLSIQDDRVRGGEAGGGALWMTDRDGFGHSQEVVRSASGHMRLAAAGSGVKLQAAETEKVCYS